MEKLGHFSTADHESCTRSSDNSISIGLLQYCSDLAMTALGLCSRFLVMLGRRQTIFSTIYCRFEKMFDFLLVYVMCLPSWHHGKQHKSSWKSRGISLSDFCGNPVNIIICNCDVRCAR